MQHPVDIVYLDLSRIFMLINKSPPKPNKVYKVQQENSTCIARQIWQYTNLRIKSLISMSVGWVYVFVSHETLNISKQRKQHLLEFIMRLLVLLFGSASGPLFWQCSLSNLLIKNCLRPIICLKCIHGIQMLMLYIYHNVVTFFLVRFEWSDANVTFTATIYVILTIFYFTAW